MPKDCHVYKKNNQKPYFQRSQSKLVPNPYFEDSIILVQTFKLRAYISSFFSKERTGPTPVRASLMVLIM
jgi:hypothetical protein